MNHFGFSSFRAVFGALVLCANLGIASIAAAQQVVPEVRGQIAVFANPECRAAGEPCDGYAPYADVDRRMRAQAGFAPPIDPRRRNEFVADSRAGNTGDVNGYAVLAPGDVYVDDDYVGDAPGDNEMFVHPQVNGGAPIAVVFGTDAFATVTDGLANVVSGGTVYVAAGNYVENVVITQPLAVIGAGQTATTIVPAIFNPDCGDPNAASSLCGGAGGPDSVVVMVQSSDVEISDLAIDGINPALPGHATDIAARIGIMTDYRTGIGYVGFNVHDTTVRNIYLRALYAPTGGGYSTFTDNTVSDVDSSVYSIGIFIRTGGGVIDGNSVSGASDAIAANFSSGIVFSNNIVTDVGSGIHTDNNNDVGANHDEIFGNSVNCGRTDSYGIWDFVPYQDVSIHDNVVTACAIGLGAFGGRTDGGIVRNTTFENNQVDGAGATASAGDTLGAWLSTTTFFFGDYDNEVTLTGNTISGYGIGVLTERTGGVALTTTAHFNRIVGNTTTGWGDSGAVSGTSDFVHNWWGCNEGPTTPGTLCDTATGMGASDPWLVLSASANPATINPGDASAIAFDLTHDSDAALAGTAFPDGTTIALSATRGNLPTSSTTTAGAGQESLTGLNSGWSTLHVGLDHADVKLIVGVTPAAAFATVNDDTLGTNPDPDATCPTPDFNTITDAIDTLAAGSKILVCSGLYPENVLVNKTLTITGAFAGTAGYDVSRGGADEAVVEAPSGISVLFTAPDAIVDGFTIAGSPLGGHAASLSGANADNLVVTNNRIVDVTAGSGWSSELGADCSADGLTFSHNLFGNIDGGGSANGRGIRLGEGHCHVQILDNEFDTMLYAVNANGGSRSLQDLTITGNRVQNTTGTAFVLTRTTRTLLRGNTVTAASGGLFISDAMDDFTASCNDLSATGNGISTFDFFGGTPNIDVRIFHNAISGGTTDLNNGMAQTLVVGSNWYGGGAPVIGGGSLLVADPLAANPIGDPGCGDNTPTQLVVRSGSPQSTPINTPFPNPLVVRAQDVLGGAVMGESVTFSAPLSGASALLGSPNGASDYNGIASTTAMANGIVGSYNVNAASGSLAQAVFVLTNQGVGSVTWDALTWVYDGNMHTPVAHLTEEPSATCVVAPATVGPNAGDYPVHVDCTGALYSASGDATATITPAPATVTLSNLTQVFDGSPQPVTVTTIPAGITVAVTYDGSTTPPSAVGDYAVVATVSDPNYSGSASATLHIIEADAPDLAVSITDDRDYQQYGELLTYTIAVSNLGNTEVVGASISSILPATLEHATPSWTCIAVGSATCTATGNGDLVDTVDIPAGGGVVYLYNAWVADDPSLGTDVITTSVTVTAAGDVAAGNDTASDTTLAVIFRDGFEEGGDGAEVTAAFGTLATPATMDTTSTQWLPLAAARQGDGRIVPLASVRGSGGDRLRVESVWAGGQLLVRIVGTGNAAQLTGWASVPRDVTQLALGLARDADGRNWLLLVGAERDLLLPLGHGTVMLEVRGQ